MDAFAHFLVRFVEGAIQLAPEIFLWRFPLGLMMVAVTTMLAIYLFVGR
jgi:hypothetical protein